MTVTDVAALELPQVDFADASLRGERFHARMRELRDAGWLAQMPYGYVVLDRESVDFFLRSKSVIFPGVTIADLFGVTRGPLREQIDRNIININGDDHRRLRGLVGPALTPRAVERYRPQIRATIAGLVDAAIGDGRCEFVGAIAKPFPSLVIAAVMGAPAADAERLWQWSNLIQRQFDPEALTNDLERLDGAVAEFYDWAQGVLSERRAAPGDDLISALLAAEERGDRLSDVECVNLVLNILVGGVDTTQSQLGHAIRLFATHPEQWELLAADPSLAAAAVDEVLRLEPITPFTARQTVEDVVWRDVRFAAGTIVTVAACTANREPGDPDELARFDITADRGEARPLTFGAGIHFCLGANLARVELQEGLIELSQRITRLELDGEPELGSISGIYGVERLPVRFEQRR